MKNGQENWIVLIVKDENEGIRKPYINNNEIILINKDGIN